MSSRSKYNLRSESAPDAPPTDHEIEDYTVGWVCALPLEMAAAKGMLEKIHPNASQQDPADHNSYILGEVWGHNVVVACLPAGIYGTISAATVASNMLRTFKSIRFGLMVGIGGGVPSAENDVRLGDIVVSQPIGTNGGVIQYDRGKTLQQDGFHRTGSLNTPPQVLLTALSRLQAEHFTEDSRVSAFLADLPHKMRERFSHPGLSNDFLFQANYLHVGSHSTCWECDHTQTVEREDRDNLDPIIHYGTIASGNQVIKDAELRDRLGQQFGALCLEMEAAGLQNFPSIVIRGICDYADSHKNKQWQFYAAATAAAFAKELLSIIPPYRVLQELPIRQMLTVASENLKISKEHLDLSTDHLAEHKLTNKILGDRAIDLYVVHNARYDSADVGESPRCERNTRVRTQKTIIHWADNEKQEYFFWLVGPAGTGKSTLIRSVADQFDRDKRLVAGYFFKRGEQGRNDTKRLFATLAMQLTETIPSFKEALRASLGDITKDAMDNKDLRFQFEKLLKEPLKQLSLSQTSKLSKIIILDALDECERPEHLSRILGFLSELCENVTEHLQLRILLTSRSDFRVIRAFESLGDQKFICKLELHRMFPEDTKIDIRMYLETKLGEIRIRSKIQQSPWPSVEDVDHLVDLATNPEPLFIYAATLVRFIYDEKYLRNPNSQLKIWLKQCSDNTSQLSQIYNPILEQIFISASKTDLDQQLHFLNAAVLAPTPLSLSSLASLLGLHIDDINCWLPGFHAVLDIPSDSHKPIRLLHKSFSDYLHCEGDPRHRYLRLDPSETHALLANRCFEIMMTGRLKRDICGIEKLDATSDDVDLDTLKRCIPFELHYSCLYWVYHWQACENPLGYGDRIYAFLLQHFLHWLEVMALEKRLSDGMESLRDLLDLTKQLPGIPSELLNFLKDANRTVLSFGSIIESAPLQIYASLLLFSPGASLIRQQFWNQRLPALGHVEGIKPEWDAYLWTLDIPCMTTGLAFSPDGKFLASADNGVRLWNASTGTYFATLEDKTRTNRTTHIQFSSNNRLFAAVNGETLRVWCITTWTEMPTIRCQSGFVVALTFSEDSQLLMLAVEDGRVEFWDVRTGVHQKTIAPPQDLDRAINTAFSPNCQIVASVHEGLIRLWTLTTGTTKQILYRHGNIECMAFSPDSKVLVSANGHRLEFWNTVTGALEYELEDNKLQRYDTMTAVAFSPDYQLLASSSTRKVRLWNMTTKEFCDLDVSLVQQVVFSPDCQLLATGLLGSSAKIKIWDTTYADRGLFHDDRGRCHGFQISPNRKLVVSKSAKSLGMFRTPIETLQLWDASTGTLQQTFTHEDGLFGVEFSSDSKSLEVRTSETELYIYNTTNGIREQIHGLQAERVARPVLYSADGQLAAVCCSDSTIKIYFAGSGTYLSTIEGHNCGINAISISPDSQNLALSLSDNTIRVWSTKTGVLKHQFHLPIGKPSPTTLAFLPSGRVLISKNEESIDLWNYATGFHHDTHKHHGVVRTFAASPNLIYIAEALYDIVSELEIIELYHCKKEDQRNTLRGHNGGAVHIVFSPDSRLLAVASSDRTVRLWDVTTSRHINTFQTYNDKPKMVSFSHDAQIIAVASLDRTIRIWNTATGRYHQMVQYDQGFLQVMILLPDELKILVSHAEFTMSWNSNFMLTTYSYDLLISAEVPRSEPGYCGIDLDTEGIWIMQDSEKLILIPPEYRPRQSYYDTIAGYTLWARANTVLFIGALSGRVIRYIHY